MCGIAGIVSLVESPVRNGRQRVDQMIRLIRHRGPDHEGIFESDDGLAVIGNTRLAIVDAANAFVVPMVAASGNEVLSLNGEIYNFESERRRLELSGAQFRTHSDTEVLLAGLAKEGDDFLQRAKRLKAGGVMGLLTQVETIKEQMTMLKLSEDRNAEPNMTYIIRKQHEIVGFCVVVINSKVGIIDLVHFYVITSMRRKGICRQVMEQILKPKARMMKFPITVDTDHADHIWRQMGFVFDGERSIFGKKLGRWVPS